jgi:hypothetical protein
MFAEKVDSDVTGTVKGYLGPTINEADYVKSAQFAAIRALRLTSGQNVASFVTSSASRDQFGGTAAASLPYANTPLDNLPLIASGRGWTEVEIQGLYDAGAAVMGSNVGGTGIICGQVPTTFKTDGVNTDLTFKYLNYMDTISQGREYFHTNLFAQYVQSRLTEGDLALGRDVVNAAGIEAYLDKLYLDLSGADFMLVQDGTVAFEYFKANRTVTLTMATGTATIVMRVPIVTQLREIIATMKISFTTTPTG